MKDIPTWKPSRARLWRFFLMSLLMYGLTFCGVFLWWRSGLGEWLDDKSYGIPCGDFVDALSLNTLLWFMGPNFKWLFGVKDLFMEVFLCVTYQWTTVAATSWLSIKLTKRLKMSIVAFVAVYCAMFLVVAYLSRFLRHGGYPLGLERW